MKIAIVGFGPRGLGALEALIDHWSGASLHVDVFEPRPYPGAGPNFSPDEHPGCLLNLPLRDVDLTRPETFEFPTFAEWSGVTDENRFLPRACLGQYLVARFDALQRSVPDSVAIGVFSERVTSVRRTGSCWTVAADVVRDGYDAVLLTLGQPGTTQDLQLRRWKDHAATHELTCLDAYPTERVVQAAEDWEDKTVAVRGLGLSTLDLLSILTTGRGGVLEDGKYVPSGREPRQILPFSLDGIAPAPKPLTAALSSRFAPTFGETGRFGGRLGEALGMDDGAAAVRHLADALLPPVARICHADATNWLATELSDPGTQRGDDPISALHRDIAMATGDAPPSVGYTVGQVWRAWQPLLRDRFRNSSAEPAVRSAIVGFDNALKRFSYGPPVDDAKLLAALIEADVVRLTVGRDPEIELTPEGWRMDDCRTASVMINAVLPTPALDTITEPLIAQLRNDGTIVSVGRDGIRTRADGAVRGCSGDGAERGLAVLGRLATGSVVASDSIHDCFGGSSDAWAREIVDGPGMTVRQELGAVR